MISYIRGTLAEKNEDSAVVEAHGVGYQIFVPVPVLSELPPLGESVKIYTYFSVREDGMSLFGFLSRQDLAMFKQLIGINGIGPKSAHLISTVMAYSRYYTLKKRVTRQSLRKAESAIEYVKPLFRGIQNEQLYLILLDDACRPMQDLRIAEGVPNRVTVDTRKLLRAVARTNSTCGILAHNHPSGLALPSEADRLTTYRIMEVTGQLGFTIIDHIIVAGEDACSMLMRGSLPEYRADGGVVQAASR